MRSATESHSNQLNEDGLESHVMQLVWKHGPCSAETIREKLGRPLKESTIRTVLRRLEEKGMAVHETEGRTYLYRAAEGRQLTAAKAVKRIVDRFCEGSVEQLLTGLVDSKVLGRDELKRLADKIARAKGERK